MDKEFELYRRYCLKNGLKECHFDSLQAYLQDKQKKTKKEEKKSSFEDFKNVDIPIQIVIPMSNLDRIKAIEDYYLWADKKEYNTEYVATFVEYKKFLLGG